MNSNDLIDVRSAVAPYEQLRAGLAARIRGGELVVGTKLPTVRALAADLGLAVNTVARAYRELEAAGLVRTEGRAGTFVQASDAATARAEHAARRYADLARSAGLTTDQAVALLESAFDR